VSTFFSINTCRANFRADGDSRDVENRTRMVAMTVVWRVASRRRLRRRGNATRARAHYSLLRLRVGELWLIAFLEYVISRVAGRETKMKGDISASLHRPSLPAQRGGRGASTKVETPMLRQRQLIAAGNRSWLSEFF